MFTHAVAFKLQDPSSESRERTAAILRSMQGRIPSLLSLELGLDELGSARAWDLLLITRFADRAGYEAYRDHPYHLDPVLRHMHQAAAEAAVVDWAS